LPTLFSFFVLCKPPFAYSVIGVYSFFIHRLVNKLNENYPHDNNKNTGTGKV